jgi:uncharacterized peroxidase-related enzyme
MSRLHTVNPDSATGHAAEVFKAIRKAVGKVPNAYATIGSNATPALLGQILQTNAVLSSQGTLTKRELEAINLAVSEASGCDYCVAAHTLTGKMAGYSFEQTRKLRQGGYDEDAKTHALVQFALRLVKTSGTLPEEAVEGLRGAGYRDAQIVEAVGAVSMILFTNMLNRVNDTTLDFPQPN